MQNEHNVAAAKLQISKYKGLQNKMIAIKNSRPK
jgi:hypothetical protein